VVAELVMQAVVVARNLGLLCDDPKA
jgi:hypothetical protein